ncbi:MAG TPA: 4Fe-4S dicluster domain-containing protein [Anaerolineales bacterium]|nr:4Fe-4S dicluster domain-containing protein [Anaerolineales bacterium]
MQYAFYYDQSRCMGCETCLVACKDWNGVKPGPANWRRITITEDGTFPALSVFNLIMSCNHCEEPVCVEVCPTEAIFKREDGIVIVNRSVCENNLECVKQCPFSAPQYGTDESEPEADPSWLVPHPMQKCTFCWDRWEAGKKPACVEACPQRALDAGPIEELMAKYPDAVRTVVGFPDSTKNPEGIALPSGDTKPSILFKPKTKAG